MEKPPYELAHLKLAVIQCDVNIDAMQAGIDKENEHKKELHDYIKQHEEYLNCLRNGNNI